MRLKRSLTLLAGTVGTALTAGMLMAGPAFAAPASHPGGTPPAHAATSPKLAHRDAPTPVKAQHGDTRAVPSRAGAKIPRRDSAKIPRRDGQTQTFLTLSSARIGFGQESSEVLTASVSAGQGGVQPTGTVTIVAAHTVICSFDLLFVGGHCSPANSQLAPGTYTLTAFYSGDGRNNPSSSLPATLTVVEGQTTTSLSLSAPTVTFGQESGVDLTVTVSPPAGADVAPAGGTFVVVANGNAICSGQLPVGNGTSVCHLSDTALPSGSYQLIAGYSGDSNYGASQTPAAQALTVTSDPTVTTVTLPAATLTVSQEAQLGYRILPVVVIPSLAATGTMTFSAGQVTLCSIQITGNAGTCTMPAGQLPPGTYQVTATYSGDQGFAGSTSQAQTLTIVPDKARATASLTLSAAKVTFRDENTEHLSVTVTGQASATPTGKVTVRAGTATVCTFTLSAGQGSCTLTAAQLRPGSYRLTATYGGDANYRGFTTTSKTLTVAKEPTATTLTLSSATVASGSEGTEQLSVQVKPGFGGTPTGRVTVSAGSASVCVIILKGAKGTCTLTAGQLVPGTYHLTASYAGTASFATSTSPAKTLTVTR